MGKSAVLARLVAVCAVAALAGSSLAVAPANADTPSVPAPSAATPDSVAPGIRRNHRTTGLRITIAGVSPGARATVRVRGLKQRKRYSKVIYRSMTLRVRPGVYRVTSRSVAATGGIDVPRVATKKLRVKKNRLTRFTVHYHFVASSPVSCATGGGAANTCVVGNTGPGGGPVFYVNEANSVGSRYLEAAPSGWSGGDDPSLAWGAVSAAPDCATLDVSGTSFAIGTGLANTNFIRAACNSPAKAPAAWAVHNYSNGAANSWYLPSRLELNQVCRYARAEAFDASATTCAGPGPLVGGFAANHYWSSSQEDASNAWTQDFFFSTQSFSNKDVLVRVRPVRAF